MSNDLLGDNLTTNTTTAGDAITCSNKHGIQDGFSRQGQCNTCKALFDERDDLGQHNKGHWHLYNVKRGIASLAPLSRDDFEHCIKLQITRQHNLVEDDSIRESSDHQACLLCSRSFNGADDVAARVVEHMRLVHGFFIPNLNCLTDLGTFLKYLGEEIFQYHECLYCGITRDSVASIQSHMRDKGHCILNLEREPELQDFWEEDTGPGQLTVDTQTLLNAVTNRRARSDTSTIKVANSSSHARLDSSSDGSTSLAMQLRGSPTAPEPLPTRKELRLSRRDEMGVLGITTHQRQALMLATRRAQTDEATATRAKDLVYARKANRQKHDQNHGPLSWAKGGLHNLLPR